MLAYLVHFKPFTLPRDTHVEVFNEATILLIHSLCLGLTTDSVETHLRLEVGEAFVGLVICNLAVNFLIFLHGLYW